MDQQQQEQTQGEEPKKNPIRKFPDQPVLTEMQEAFCQHYLYDLNASKAARKAGYSPATAGQLGYQLLHNPEYAHVQARMKELMDARAAETKVDAHYVLQKLKTISEAKIEDFVELINHESFSGRGKNRKKIIVQQLRWKDFSQLSDEQKGCIQSMRQGKDGISLKLYDKSWSLDMIAKHIGLYEADNSQKKPEGVAIYLPDNGRDKPKPE